MGWKGSALQGLLLVLTVSASARADSALRPLRVQLTSEPVTLDPARAEDGNAIRILSNLMEGLVGLDDEGKLEFRLAEGVQVSRDQKRLSFKLRAGRRWSDGEPVRAEDFVAGLRRSLGPEAVSKLAPLFDPIQGAREFRERRSKDLPGIRAESGKLILKLERPAPYLLQALTLPLALPYRTGVETGVGPVTGPYRVSERKPGQHLQLEPNPLYPQAVGRHPVRLVVVSDETTGARLFERGDLDVLVRVPALEVAGLRKKGLIREEPFAATFYLGFQCERGVFRNVWARRLVSEALNRQQMVALLGTGEQVARGFVPPGLWGSSFGVSELPPPISVEDRVRARKELGAAGKILLAMDAGARNQLLLERAQAEWSEKLSLKVQLQVSDWKTHIGLLGGGSFDLYRFGWMAPFADPLVHLLVFTSQNPNNYGHYTNRAYDRLVEEISAMKAGPDRDFKIREAQRILVDEDVAVIPIYHYVQVSAVSPRLRGFRTSPFGVIRFNQISALSP